MAKEEDELKLNTRLYAKDRFAEYNKVMNPQSSEECKVPKEIVEKSMKEKFARGPLKDSTVPRYMPAVATPMDDMTITVGDLREALVGKKGKASPGRDGVTYAMLREVVKIEKVADRLVVAMNRVLNGTDDIPLEWSDARIRLLYKSKGDPKLFDNYRPLAITSILGKALNTIIKTKMLAHCRRHRVIDEAVQKGFMPKVSGCMDHIAAMMQIMRVAKNSNKEFFALLLDLKAAYDSVPHNKLWALLRHVGISEQIVGYLTRLYASSKLYVQTKSFTTASIPYARGVLQGDTLSPLLFTIFFMVILKAGSQGHTEKGFTTDNQFLHHLKAFADDLNVIEKSLERLRETWKHLKEGLDWCELEVNKSKCRILHFTKKEYVEVPTGIEIEPDFVVKCGVKEGASFLGLEISRCMKSAEVFEIMKERLVKELDKITRSKYPLNAKLFFYEVGVLAKFRWWFAIYENIPLTSVQKLQNIAYGAFRKWHARFKGKLTGEVFTSLRAYNIENLVKTYRTARAISLLNGLKAEDPATQAAYKSKATLPPRRGQDDKLHKLIAQVEQKEEGDQNDYTTKGGLKKEAKAFMAKQEKTKRSHLKGLGWCWALDPFDDEDESLMGGVMRKLNEDELSWCCMALCGQLDTKAERARKMRTTADRSTTLCPLCNQYQNLKHVLNCCPTALREGRYTQRHDAVLKAIADRIALANGGNKDSILWADLEGYRQPDKFPDGFTDEDRNGYRPDIMITIREGSAKRLVIIELTCPFEENLRASHSNKVEKYTRLKDTLMTRNCYSSIDLHCVEVGSRGFIANTLKEITPYITVTKRGHPKVKSFLMGLGHISLRHSRRIYRKRNITNNNINTTRGETN